MNGIRIETGDFRELSDDLADDSVALILTDPIYRNIDDYAYLAEVGARVLGPDGACLSFCENTLLHDCLNAMTPHLEFVRVLTIFMSGVTVGRHYGKMFVKTTPCLWTGRGWTQPKHRVWDISVGVSNRRKNGQYHQWGKDPRTIERWVLAFTDPGDLVLDPFLGGGTTAVACLQTGRRCLGYEIDPAVADVARERVANAQLPLFVPDVVGQLAML